MIPPSPPDLPAQTPGPGTPGEMPPRPQGPTPPVVASHQRQAEAKLLGRARLLSFLVVALLAVTALGYSVYVVTGLGETQVVLNNVQAGYWTTSNVTNPTTGGVTTTNYHVGPANNSTTPIGSMAIPTYFSFLKWSVLVDLAMVWFLVIFTAFSILRPSNLKDPSKLLDIFYLNMLFGFVFWPLAALGSYLGVVAPAAMLGLGLIPAIALTVFVGRFVEEGTGGPILFPIILTSMAIVMVLNLVLWGSTLSAGDTAIVGLVEVVFPLLYFVRAFFDRTEPLKSRPLIGELLLWGGLGVVISAVVGVALMGSFNGAAFDILTVSSLFTGSTDLLAPNMQPWSFIHGISPSSSGDAIAMVLPLIFGLTGILTAIMSIPPLLAVGDFLMVRSGVSVAEECVRCHKPYIAVKTLNSGYCTRCRVLPQVLRDRQQQARGANAPPPPLDFH